MLRSILGGYVLDLAPIVGVAADRQYLFDLGGHGNDTGFSLYIGND
jgi:hypothetical protein